MLSISCRRWTRARIAVLVGAFVLVAATPALARPDLGGITQVARVTASDAGAGDAFGYSVAIDGDVAVVGASMNDAVGADAGAAYIFEEDAEGWSGVATLRPDDLGLSDRFGQAVAVSGDVVVVGSPRDDDLGTDTGAVYVYRRTDGIWALETKLIPTGAGSYARAGAAVAVDGDTLAFAGGGKVYVCVDGPEGWAAQSVLASPSGVYDYFGCSLGLSGDTLVGGAYGFQSIYDEGRAYVFARSGDTWALDATLAASDGESNDMFGFGVDVDGDTVVVGAWGDDDAGSSAGAAYAFTRADDGWTQSAKIVPAGTEAYDEVGYFVSIADGWAVLSAHGDDDVAADAGAAYVYDASGGWTLLAKLIAEDGAAGDVFGNPATDAARVIAGCIGSDVVAPDGGAAYLFGSGSSVPGKQGPQKQGLLAGLAE